MNVHMDYNNYKPEQKTRIRVNYWRLFGLLFVALLLVWGGIFIFKKYYPTKPKNVSAGYQAIFMEGGQVYFGKMTGKKDGYVTLEHVYYVQAGSQGSAPQEKTTGSEISLVRLGSELHSPESKMYINEDHIMFYEDLRPDSQVLRSILSNEQK